jgi:hypothetical protein
VARNYQVPDVAAVQQTWGVADWHFVVHFSKFEFKLNLSKKVKLPFLHTLMECVCKPPTAL